MCVVQDGTAGCFIYTTGFHANHTVFADICDTNAISAADLVQQGQHFHRTQLFAIYGNRDAFFKVQSNIFGHIGRFFGGYAKLQDMVIVGFICGVFQFQAFVAQVPDVSVTAIGIVVACFKRNAMLCQIFDLVFTGFHFPGIQSPGSDDLHFRRQCFYSQFKTHLVVAFACCAMADSCCAFLFCDLHQSFCDDGTGHGCTQEVFAFINSVGLDAGVDGIHDKFFCQVFDIQLGSACGKSLLFQAFCFLALTYVAAYADDFAVIVFFQPGDDCGCIQTAGICQYDFFFCHDVLPP